MRMRKIIISLVMVFALACASFAAKGTTKRDFMFNLPDDINWGTYQQVDIDIPTASTTSILATHAIDTTTLTGATTAYTLALGDITDIILPRNLVVDASFSTGEATTTVTGSMVIAGMDQFGISATETLAVSTNSATGAVAWSTLLSLTFSDFVISGASTGTINLSVGTGNKIALMNNIRTSGDVLKVIEAGATSTSYVLNTTYDTIDFATDPDASNDYYTYYIGKTQRARLKY